MQKSQFYSLVYLLHITTEVRNPDPEKFSGCCYNATVHSSSAYTAVDSDSTFERKFDTQQI